MHSCGNYRDGIVLARGTHHDDYGIISRIGLRYHCLLLTFINIIRKLFIINLFSSMRTCSFLCLVRSHHTGALATVFKIKHKSDPGYDPRVE